MYPTFIQLILATTCGDHGGLEEPGGQPVRGRVDGRPGSNTVCRQPDRCGAGHHVRHCQGALGHQQDQQGVHGTGEHLPEGCCQPSEKAKVKTLNSCIKIK